MPLPFPHVYSIFVNPCIQQWSFTLQRFICSCSANVYSSQTPPKYLILGFLFSKYSLYAFVFLGEPLKVVHIEAQSWGKSREWVFFVIIKTTDAQNVFTFAFWRQMCISMNPILCFCTAPQHLAYHPSETPWAHASLIKPHQHMTRPVFPPDHVPACQVSSLSSSCRAQHVHGNACRAANGLTLHFPRCHLKILAHARAIGRRDSRLWQHNAHVPRLQSSVAWRPSSVSVDSLSGAWQTPRA